MTTKERKQLFQEFKAHYAERGYEFINPHTKQAETIRAAFEQNRGSIYQAYGRCSREKERIYDRWLRDAAELPEMYGFHVSSANTFNFTLAFRFFDNAVTGEEMTAYITPAHNYITTSSADF